MSLETRKRISRRIAAVLILFATACTTVPGQQAATNSSPPRAFNGDRTYSLGHFPAFPSDPLPASLITDLQNVLDQRLDDGDVQGVAAAVVVADVGSWTGAVGSALDAPTLTLDMRRPIGSVGKTITAAQVVRLAEDGLVDLDHPATRYLPKGVKFETNGASVRDLLRMQSGIPDPPDIFAAIELGPTGFLAKVPHKRLYGLGTDCGGRDLCIDSNYSNTNYLLLGMIIEEVTGRPIAESLALDVLSHPGLEGIIYRADDATGAMGLMSSDAGSLARWGYLLYGGGVLSDGSLEQISDYRNNYGLGAMEMTKDPDDPGIGHLGNDRHDSAGLVVFPRAGIAIAVLTPTGNCCTRISNMIDDLRYVIASHPGSN